MKQTVFILVCLLNLINGNYVDVRVASLSSLGRNSHTCTSTNVFCGSNCLFKAKCINGVAQNVFTCPSGQFCSDDNGSPICSDTMGVKCFMKLPNIQFKCAGLGFFPDIIACNKYHFCYETYGVGGTTSSITTSPDVLYDPSVNYIAITLNCDVNTIYNPATSTCEPYSRPCPSTFAVRICKFPGESFQVSGPIYAICQQYSTDHRIIYPFLYRCKINKFPCPQA